MKISWTVFKLQSGHEFVIDRQTDRWMDDPGKNNMSPPYLTTKLFAVLSAEYLNTLVLL